MTDKDKNLLGACLIGKKSSWDTFVLQYAGLVCHTIKKTFVHYHTESRNDVVEDLFQDFFLSLIRDNFKKLRQFKGDRGCSLASWLRVVATRQTIDFLRRQQTSTARAIEKAPSDHPDPPGSMLDQERNKLLSQVLETLPPRDRLFIQLYFQHSLTPKEVASVLRVSVNSIYTQKSRVLDKLREALNKYEVCKKSLFEFG